MVKFSQFVKFPSKFNTKKGLREEVQREIAQKKDDLSETLATIQQYVNETPGLTAEQINHKLEKAGIPGAYVLLPKFVKQGSLKRRRLDSFLRYYAPNYQFSDELKEKKAVDNSSDSKERLRQAAIHMNEVRGKTKDQAIELVKNNPGISGPEIERQLGRQVNLYRYARQGRLRRELGSHGEWHYFMPDSKPTPPPSTRLAPRNVDQQKAAQNMRERMGLAQEEVIALITKEPGLAHPEITKRLGRMYNLTKYFHQGKVQRELGADGRFHYYPVEAKVEAKQTPKYDQSTGFSKALQLLRVEPGLTQKEIHERVGVGVDLIKAVKKGELKREARPNKAYVYYLPDQEINEATKDEAVTSQIALTDEQLATAKAAVLEATATWWAETKAKLDTENSQVINVEAPREDLATKLERLAMRYVWENKGDTDLHNFVTWAKGAVVDDHAPIVGLDEF